MTKLAHSDYAASTVNSVLLYDLKAEKYASRISDHVGSAEIIPVTSIQEAVDRGANSTILIALAHNITEQLVTAMPQLKWVQALTTGVDPLLKLLTKRPQTLVTNARGIPGPQMSELALLMMMSLARDFARMQANQKAARWERWPQPILSGKKVVVVGVGSISEELAARCQAFGMSVVGISESRKSAPNFDAVVSRAELKTSVADADFIVLLVPATPETRHIVNADVLAAVKPSAFLMNLARGACLDHAALLAALRSRRLAGAGLDVFDSEPLDPSDPLWSEPNVLITPHIGGFSDSYVDQMAPLIAHNLQAFLSGTPDLMRNVVTVR